MSPSSRVKPGLALQLQGTTGLPSLLQPAASAHEANRLQHEATSPRGDVYLLYFGAMQCLSGAKESARLRKLGSKTSLKVPGLAISCSCVGAGLWQAGGMTSTMNLVHADLPKWQVDLPVAQISPYCHPWRGARRQAVVLT